MRPDRLRWVHLGLAAFGVALVARAAQVQLLQHDRWKDLAERQQLDTAARPAPRGTIRDTRGVVLAESRELVKLAIAPTQVPERQRRALAKALRDARVPEGWVRRASDRSRKWVELPTRFFPADAAELAAMSGVYATPLSERSYVPSEAVRRIVGRATATGGLDGLEFAFDSLLTGRQGSVTLVKDGRARRLETPDDAGIAAQPGHDITLTIDYALQDVAERALAAAQARTGASGGDIVVVEPATGRLLALASRRPDARSTAATTLTEPYEPGSTLKPLVAARLLDLRRAAPDERIPTYGGRWTIGRRTITDVHRADDLSLTEVLAFSSNIGIVQFAARLSPREQFELLRDAGFGTPTGVPYPLEASGTLREPARWSGTSAASLAMGYEIAVTPVQLAMAYAAIANGGELMAPALVQRVVSPDGTVRYRHEPRVVRRLMSPEAARTVRDMLVAVVEDGTAGTAELARYAVAGKSGTARVATGGAYEQGRYAASFVGMFPADDPQLVVLVKLDDPQGAYYGGTTAAPVFKAVVQGVLGARDVSVDRARLAAAVRGDDSANRPAPPDTLVAAAAVPADTGDVPVVVALGEPATAAPTLPPRPVPDVSDLPLRRAIHTLHGAGFRVALSRRGGRGTVPQAGTVLRAGATVTLAADW